MVALSGMERHSEMTNVAHGSLMCGPNAGEID